MPDIYKDQHKLILEAQGGSKEAMETLISTNQGLIVTTLKNYLTDKLSQHHDDLYQIANHALLKAIQTYNREKNRSFYNYASVCIRNSIIDELRVINKQNENVQQIDNNNEDEPTIEIKDELTNIEDKLIDEDTSESIRKLLSEILTKRQFDVISLYIEEYSYSEIAKKLDISQKAVDNAIAGAKRKILACKEAENIIKP